MLTKILRTFLYLICAVFAAIFGGVSMTGLDLNLGINQFAAVALFTLIAFVTWRALNGVWRWGDKK